MPATRSSFRHVLVAAALVAATAGVTLSPPVSAQPGGGLRIVTLSNRADLVSGGGVLVEVVLPAGVDPASVRVEVDGRDVTDAFAVRDDGRYIGLVTGLIVGDNELTAALSDGSGARLTVANHPIGGPLFAGTQVQPWICNTARDGLGPHTDDQCNAQTRIRWFYRDAVTDSFLPYDPVAPPAGAIATTTTDEGETVPYIVREETLTQNRGLATVAVLADPAQEEIAPWSPPPAWNRKVLYVFGGGGGPHHQQEPPPSALDDHALSRGFLVASSSLNVQRYTLNNNVQAESVVMLKEHIVETYGEIRRTIGEGCSGGSIQQHIIASMYPGLLDGLIPSCSFPDTWTQGTEISDCWLTQRYFDEVSPQLWADASQQGAVQGKTTTNTCRAWNALFAGIFDPTTVGRPDCGLPDDQVYDPETNPDGVRCTIQDYQKAIWGPRPQDGFARRPLDNVGVQYGLLALEEGTISPAQFVDLNAKIGSIDIDFRFVPERMEADPGSLEIAYRTNQVTDVRHLADLPILDLRGHSTEEVHENYNSYEMRARLDRDNGHHDNQVIWTGAVAIYGDQAFACGLAETGLIVGLGLKDIREVFPTTPMSDERCTADPLGVMDAWLDGIDADTSDLSRAEKVVANKPEGLVDMCFVSGQPVTDMEQCNALYPSQRTPHMMAGGPLAEDILKCQLTPLNRDHYTVEFTDEEWALMEATFPTGVCDWSAPGVDQQPSVPWLTYTDGPGGRPLGDPPASDAVAADEGARIVRHAGRGRVETAVAVSGRGVGNAEVVVLARSDDFADALAGGPLAVVRGAPLLLTSPDNLDVAPREELRRLGTKEAILLGGTAALSDEVVADLELAGVTVTRIAGPTRYATAAAVAAELPPSDEVFVARGDGDGFADALGASAVAAAAGAPVLLVSRDALPDETAAALPADASVTIAGGSAAVSAGVMAAIDERAGTVRRLAGPDRYATSAALAREALSRGAGPSTTWLATGRDFPDALVAGTAAARDAGLLLLIDGQDLASSRSTRDLLTEQAAAIDTLRIAGGRAAISESVEAALASLL